MLLCHLVCYGKAVIPKITNAEITDLFQRKYLDEFSSENYQTNKDIDEIVFQILSTLTMTPEEEKKFWEKQRPESRIKALLVSDYFPQYCKIVDRGKGEGFIYIDLWAGRGKYGDGNLSTPLLLADIIAKDSYLKQKVTFAFNDLNNIEILKENFKQRYGDNTFTKQPHWGHYDAEKSEIIKNYLNKKHSTDKINNPTLLFFDPFGYAGVDTLGLANFLKPWGNELFLFLNVNRIIPALTNPKVQEHIAIMFPTQKSEVIEQVKTATNDEKRVSIILKSLVSEFKKVIGDKLITCAFKFMENGANKTSHLIIHFTKHPKGFKLVKQVFYDYDNIGAVLNADGSFTFDAKKAYPTGIIDFSMDDNHINLAEELSKKFAGKKVSAAQLIDLDQANSMYAPTHYVKALRLLHDQGRLEADFTDSDKVQHKVSILPSTTCILKFPN